MVPNNSGNDPQQGFSKTSDISDAFDKKKQSMNWSDSSTMSSKIDSNSCNNSHNSQVSSTQEDEVEFPLEMKTINSEDEPQHIDSDEVQFPRGMTKKIINLQQENEEKHFNSEAIKPSNLISNQNKESEDVELEKCRDVFEESVSKLKDRLKSKRL